MAQALRSVVRRQRLVNIGLAVGLGVMVLVAATGAPRSADRPSVVEVLKLVVVNAEGKKVFELSGTGIVDAEGGTVARFGPDGIWARSFRVGRSGGAAGYFGVDGGQPALTMSVGDKSVVDLRVGTQNAGVLTLWDHEGFGLFAADGVSPR